ncbi:hypothetical protein [Spirosoma fluviale]|uniref:Uncharacterized protein n=1 Tax=Spirosoma fluviale TaxID=1597977 RepID=A0A286GS32_9BACT|nr:hypothetical protein [Spirosoma fluviale]SOD97869.1 hypothetical protein SAMN06269250_5949 [Spirosoma fluviale]
MRSLIVVGLVGLMLSCQKSLTLNEQLYGKWQLTGGSALVKRQTMGKPQPDSMTIEFQPGDAGTMKRQ